MQPSNQTIHFSNLSPKDQSLKYAGKRLLRQEIPLDSTTFAKLLAEQQFTETPSMARQHWKMKCLRCGNQAAHLIGRMPCYRCQATHAYCRKCIRMGRVSECDSLYTWSGESPCWTKHENPCTWEGQLTSQQQLAANRIVQAIDNQERELLIYAVCGAGKTEMLFPGITAALQQGWRVCIATPRADVVRELKPRLQTAFHDVTIEALYGGSPDRSGTAQLLLATTHQLLRFYRAFDLMIIDEIDAFPYHADPSLPYATKQAITNQATIIYLTATPRPKDQSRLNRGKLPHVFVPVRYHGHPLPVPQLKLVWSLKKHLQQFTIPKELSNWLINRKQSNRQLLIFTPTIKLAEGLYLPMAALLQKLGIIEEVKQLATVHAEDPKRTEKVQQFRNKQLSALITTTILERGVTFPSVDVAILAAGHRVFDEAALVQIAGRAGRSATDPTGEVIFFHDGKTDAMLQAIHSIKKMNHRAGLK